MVTDPFLERTFCGLNLIESLKYFAMIIYVMRLMFMYVVV